MQVSSSSMFGSIFSASQTSKTKPAATGVDMSWANAAPADDTASSARSQFNDYMKMTPAEKMHAALLAQMGVTEEEYKAMDADKRKAIDDMIKEKIKEQMEAGSGHKNEAKTGLIADIKV